MADIEINNVSQVQINRKMGKVTSDPVERFTIAIKSGREWIYLTMKSHSTENIDILIEGHRTDIFNPREE